MSSKELLASSLMVGVASLEASENVFPELSVPSEPSTALDAVLCSAKCLRQEVIWLNSSFSGIKVSDYVKSFGCGSPSAAYIAMGASTITGAISSGAHFWEHLRINGMDSEGGLVYVGETEAVKSGGLDALDLIGSALSLFPMSEEISQLGGLWGLAKSMLISPVKSIALAVGVPLANNVLALLTKYLYDKYLARPIEFELPDCVCEHLGTIANELTKTGGNWYNEIGLPTMQSFLSVMEGILGSIADQSERINSSEHTLDGDGNPVYAHSHDLYRAIREVREVLRNIVSQTPILEIGNDAIYLRSQIVGFPVDPE
jgi:hypothetical protein